MFYENQAGASAPVNGSILSSVQATESLRQAMAERNLFVRGQLIADGQIQRFKNEGDKSANSWYVVYLDQIPSGAFGCWKLGISEKWSARKPIDYLESLLIRERITKAQKLAEETRRQLQANAGERARQLWKRSGSCCNSHPYLINKQIQPYNVQALNDLLVIPLVSIKGGLENLQIITTDGTKRFLKHGRITGLFCPIGSLSETARILICEGFATGVTLFEQMGYPVACAMTAGNLKAVALAIRKAYPTKEIVICADNDRFTDGNPGLTKAKEAAHAINAKLVWPEFPENAEGTDFNDLALLGVAP